jgi:hypothetical protein
MLGIRFQDSSGAYYLMGRLAVYKSINKIISISDKWVLWEKLNRVMSWVVTVDWVAKENFPKDEIPEPEYEDQ